MILNRITDWIGQTPLLELSVKQSRWRLLVKLEKFNPGNSMKDRMARSMVDAAEQSGKLKPGGAIVESTSGNTGLGLAIVAAERGYKFIAVVDHHTAKDKILAIRALGATIVEIGSDKPDDRVATKDREVLAKEIANKTPGAVLMAQHENPANAAAYYSLADDLLQELPKIDILIGSIGTGGSLCGTSTILKKKLPLIKVYGVEPKGSIVFGAKGGAYFQSGTGVPPDVELGSVIDYSLLDGGGAVDDIAAFNTCRFIAHQFGVLLGGSAGAVLYAAFEKLRHLQNEGVMVALAADGGEKYLDTIYNNEWMAKNQLLNRSIETDLAIMLNFPSQERVNSMLPFNCW